MTPIALYIHFPWCVKKCPYCDFNSHALKGELPEEQYIDALLLNLEQYAPHLLKRPIMSIFMGGGTPSLFSPQALERLLNAIHQRCQIASNIEITLEANPGTVEQARFKDYYTCGINRLSLGIQSFDDQQLKTLGRIHDSNEAKCAITAIQNAGFTNFNLDLMFALPNQSIFDGLTDLEQAIAFEPTHLSWYELTLEPNTVFWHQQPPLPTHENAVKLQEEGQALLASKGYQQYEVSAYSRSSPCRHNLNYWEFGDYLAIGAGSHAKIDQFTRLDHFRHPKQYMDSNLGFIHQQHTIAHEQRAFEFFLNTLRLKNGVPKQLFQERTHLPFDSIEPQLAIAQQKGWIKPYHDRICTTDFGYRFLNDVVGLFIHEYEN